MDQGYKIPMPKYYRDKILDKDLKDKQIQIIKKAVDEQEIKRNEQLIKQKRDPEKVKQSEKRQRSYILKRGERREID